MSHRHVRLALWFAAALFAVGVPLAAFAQAVDVEAVEPEPRDRVGFGIRTGYDHMFQTDVNNVGGGDVSRDSFQASLGGRFKMDEKFGFTPRFIYELNHYDFSSSIDVWRNINQYTLVGVFDYQLGEQWTLLAGPVFRLAGEGSGAFDNGFTGGGLLGATFKASEDLTLGAALGVISQLEDDPGIIPIPILRWHFAEPFTLKAGIDQLGGRTGLGPELVWHLSKELDLGLGAQYQRRRFRLDNNGNNRKGIGEDSSAPFFVRLGYKPMENLTLEASAGVVAAGELKIQDKNGGNTTDKGYEATPTLGLRGEYRF
jgi:hypothetical protein